MTADNQTGSTFRPELGKAPESPLFVFWQDLSEALIGNKSLAAVGWRQRSPHLTPSGICQRAGLSVNCVNTQAVLITKLSVPTMASSIPRQTAGLMERKQPKPAYCQSLHLCQSPARPSQTPGEAHPYVLQYALPCSDKSDAKLSLSHCFLLCCSQCLHKCYVSRDEAPCSYLTTWVGGNQCVLLCPSMP